MLPHWIQALRPPANAAAHGAALDRQMWESIVAMLLLFVIAHVLLAFAAWRKWRSAVHKDGIKAAARFSLADTALIAGVAALYVVLALQAESLWAAVRFQGASPGAMQVEVVGRQFQWYFRYPGADGRYGAARASLVDAAAANPLGLDRSDEFARDDFVTSELVLPAGREVDLRVRSLDVVHGFFIPAMRLKQNAVPGSEFHVHFTPETPGIYDIVCTQVCGLGHYRMGAKLRVLSQQDFAAWLAKQKPAVGAQS